MNWWCMHQFFFNTIHAQVLLYTRIHSPLWRHTRTPYPYEHLRETEPAYLYLYSYLQSLISNLYSYKNRVGDDCVSAILQYRPSDLYLTDRRKLWQFTRTPCYLLSTALDFPEEERMMQQSSVSISLSFWEPRYQSSRRLHASPLYLHKTIAQHNQRD